MNRAAAGHSDKPVDPAGDALNRRLQIPGRRLFVGGERSVRKTLVIRAVAVLTMFALVIAVFWFDRDGLRDSHDGSISFADVVYSTMVSVTTVGYGDIVPVTRQARLIDALLVTPIRLFIWLIFVGTAYQLVLQRLIEDFRMRRLQARLQGHVVLCGFGHAGRLLAISRRTSESCRVWKRPRTISCSGRAARMRRCCHREWVEF